MTATATDVGTLSLTGLDFEYLAPCEAEYCKEANLCPGPADYLARYPCHCTWLTCAQYLNLWLDQIRQPDTRPIRCPKCWQLLTVSDIAQKTTWSRIR